MTVFTVVFAITVIFLLGLILDGGMALNARQRAEDIAGQAARAAADHIDVGVLRSTGRAVIAPGACFVAQRLASIYSQDMKSGIDRVTSLSNFRCLALPETQTATVQITITTQPLVPGLPGGFTETGSATATVQCGILQGGACG